MAAALVMAEKPKRGKSFTRQVGARIAFMRERAGLSQAATAKRAGLVQSHVCNMENGERNIDIEKLYVIAKTLGCKVVDLLPLAEGGTLLSEKLRLMEEAEDEEFS